MCGPNSESLRSKASLVTVGYGGPKDTTRQKGHGRFTIQLSIYVIYSVCSQHVMKDTRLFEYRGTQPRFIQHRHSDSHGTLFWGGAFYRGCLTQVAHPLTQALLRFAQSAKSGKG